MKLDFRNVGYHFQRTLNLSRCGSDYYQLCTELYANCRGSRNWCPEYDSGLLDVKGPVIAVKAGDAPVARIQARREIWRVGRHQASHND